MTNKVKIIIVAFLALLLVIAGYLYLSDKAKANIIFFGTLALIVIFSGILIAIGLKAFLKK